MSSVNDCPIFVKENDELYLKIGQKKAKLNELVTVVSNTGQRVVAINNEKLDRIGFVNDLVIALNKSLKDKNNTLQKEDFQKIYARITQIADNTRLQKLPIMTRLRHALRAFFGGLSFNRNRKLARVKQRIFRPKTKQASPSAKLANAKVLKTSGLSGLMPSQKSLSLPKATPLVFNWLALHQNEQFDLKVSPPLKIWMTVSDAGTSKEKRVVTIQVQNTEHQKKLQECSLTLDSSNRILSTDKVGDLSDADWEKHLEKGFENFIKTKALKLSFQQLHIHPLIVSEYPEYLLQIIYKNGHFDLPSFGVDFLTDELQPGSAWDRGGPSRELISNLADALMKNAPVSVIQKNKWPILIDSHQKHLYGSLAKMFSACLNSEYKFGDHLAPAYFELLKNVLLEKISSEGRAYTDDEIAHKVVELADLFKDTDSRMEVWKDYCRENLTKDDLTRDDLSSSNDDSRKRVIEKILDEADSLMYDDAQEYVDEAKDYIVASYGPIFKAVEAVVEALSPACRAALIDPSPAEINMAIQGHFSSNLMINALECDSTNAVIQQKVAWLKEKIQEDPAWGQRLLFVMTGAFTITPEIKLNIKEAADDFCHAHTCFARLDLPSQHVNAGTGTEKHAELALLSNLERHKALFFNNLNMIVPENILATQNMGFDDS